MPEEVELTTDTGVPYRARLRPGKASDRVALVASWVPLLERGPESWLDVEWPWRTFGATDLHLDRGAEWMVLADEVEAGSAGGLLGVLVTTGPATAHELGIGQILAPEDALLWLEYIAIAPSIRPDCPSPDQRTPRLKGVGPPLMRAAIERSRRLGLEGRIGLHAEGEQARQTYSERWKMASLGAAAHRAGGTYPVYFGDATWAAEFCSPSRGRRSG